MSFTRDDSQRCRADFPALARTQAGRPLETLPTDVLQVQEHKPPYLIETGICVWDGHFYAARAVEALGLASNGLLRAGFSMYNQMHEIDRLLEALRRISS